MNILSVDFSKPVGTIKPINGVNNGPVTGGGMLNVSEAYAQLKLPYARLHDPNWPHPREVDIPQIFPDFTKDVNDPNSYDFRQTDDYIRSILDCGTQILYRLGVSIEHTKRKIYTHPPTDPAKWAQICVGIIKHYNDGWADGYHYGIKYWEIWNEPDNPDGDCMWSGTPEQYYELYHAASVAIKSYNPELKVGGFGATSINPEFTNGFLSYCQQHQLPLDFFSWHVYTQDLSLISKIATETHELVAKYGYPQAESWLDEWNYVPDGLGALFDPHSDRHVARKAVDGMRDEIAASFVTSAMVLMQQLPIDGACYYDGQPDAHYCGIWDPYGINMKPFYGFLAFRQMADCKIQVHADQSEPNGLYVCASANAEHTQGCLMICNPSSEALECQLEVSGVPASANLSKMVVDHDRDLEEVKSTNIPQQTYGAYSITLYRWDA